jgi:anti-anti-sigma regulatory factor
MTMIFQTFLRIAATVAMISTGIVFASEDVCAQVIDFSQIDAFESMGTGTLHGASQPTQASTFVLCVSMKRTKNLL